MAAAPTLNIRIESVSSDVLRRGAYHHDRTNFKLRCCTGYMPEFLVGNDFAGVHKENLLSATYRALKPQQTISSFVSSEAVILMNTPNDQLSVLAAYQHAFATAERMAQEQSEGRGVNLTMQPIAIRALGERGSAQLLSKAFALYQAAHPRTRINPVFTSNLPTVAPTAAEISSNKDAWFVAALTQLKKEVAAYAKPQSQSFLARAMRFCCPCLCVTKVSTGPAGDLNTLLKTDSYADGIMPTPNAIQYLRGVVTRLSGEQSRLDQSRRTNNKKPHPHSTNKNLLDRFTKILAELDACHAVATPFAAQHAEPGHIAVQLPNTGPVPV